MTLKPIAFSRQSYQGPGNASAQRLLNAYMEPMPEDAANRFVVRASPGLLPRFSMGPGPTRALNDTLPGRLYTVSGGEFWRLRPATDGGAEYVGAVDNNTAMATIAVGPVNGCVVVTPNAWAFDHLGGLRPIGGDFPGAASVAYLDGYFIFTSVQNNSQFFVSALLDAETIDPLDFAFADQTPNVIRRVISHRRQIWLMGEAGIEVWYNSGDADFPFRPVAGGVIVPGTTSPKAVAVADGSVWWIGSDGIVFRSNGYQAARVSTHAIERDVAKYSPTNEAIMCSYSHEGHWSVAINLQSILYPGKTIIYDCASQMWHERSSGAAGAGPWRGAYAGHAEGVTLIGDASTGQLHVLDNLTSSDVGQVLRREVVLPEITAHGLRAFMSRLEVELETGNINSPFEIRLSWSDDGGITYTGERAITTGAPGEYRHRVYFTRLGSFRRRMLRLRCDGLVTFRGADAEIDAGVA